MDQYQYEKAGNEARSRKPVKRNDTGIPPQLKRRVEESSGFSLDDVRVSYHSDRPARLDARAYTQGNRVYIGPGQERHLPHELGHVVQQKQGIVRADTRHASGVKMNTDPVLERQADEIGRAMGGSQAVQRMAVPDGPVQRNPFDKSTDREPVGGLPQTAHHIIPQNLLKAALALLSREQKRELYWCAGVPWMQKDSSGNFIETEQVSYINQYNETEEDYLIWPQGNLFYGPNTMIRAETGEKEGFDYDARYMSVMEPDRFEKMKAIYSDLQSALKAGDGDGLFEILKAFYGLTALEGFESGSELAERMPVLQAPAAYSQDDWMEITELETLEKIKKYRNNVGRYTYFKVPVDRAAGPGISAGCAKEAGGTWRYQYKDNSKTVVIKNVTKIINLGANGFFLLAGYSKSPDLKRDGAAITVYLPARLVDYINSLEEMWELRDSIVRLEKNQPEIIPDLLQRFGPIELRILGSERLKEMTEHCPLHDFCQQTVVRYRGKPIPLENINQEKQAADLKEECSRILSAYQGINTYCMELERLFDEVGARIAELKSADKPDGEKQSEAAGELSGIENAFVELRERLAAFLLARRTGQEAVCARAARLEKIFS